MDNDDFVLVEKQDDGEFTHRVTIEIEKIASWLSPTEFETEGSEYQKHLSALTSGTGDWLFRTAQYQAWHDANINTLWLQGIPGSGKSVMAAKLVHTLKEEGVPVLFFFARRIIKSNSEPRQLVQDCLYQLLGYSAVLRVKLKMLLAQDLPVGSVSFHELWSIFLFGLETLPKVYILFDALDELAIDNEGFLQSLQSLGQRSPKSAKLIITSRPEAHLQAALRSTFQNCVRLTGAMVDQDIATYIAHRVTSQQDNLAVAESQSIVQDRLCHKAQGLFLYARLMLDQILMQSTLSVEKHLQHLPSSLEEMYVNILHDHSLRSGASQHFQFWLLSWVTHACRPLRVTELATLINSCPDRGGLSSSQDAKAMICRSCGPLLEILDNGTVQVIHHSFTEFLLDGSRNTATSLTETSNWFPVLTPTSTHRSLTLLCVGYLLSGCFSSWSVPERPTKPMDHEPGRKQLMVHFPFLQYASQNLLYHAAKCDASDAEYILKLDTLFQNDKHSFESWKDFLFAKMNQIVPNHFHPLHLAAQAGLTGYTQHLLTSHTNPDIADSCNRTTATYACMYGHTETLAALLGHKASVTISDIDGLSPIHHAVRGNHVEVVQLLLEAGADPMSPKTREDRGYWRWSPSTLGKTPVHFACELGHTACVLELLRNLDLSSKRSLLPHWASATGQSNTLEVLLRDPIILENLNKRDADGNTALFLAARRADSETVRMLLNCGADVNARSVKLDNSKEALSNLDISKSKRGQTPIHAWTTAGYRVRSKLDICTIEEWHQTGVRLIKAGCDLEAKNEMGQTALFAWTKQFMCAPRGSNRTELLVELLLKYGANPCATDNQGYTPLHNLSKFSMNPRVIEMFVEAGADINYPRHGDLVTPLISAAINQIADVTPLIENGADPNLQDSDGNTALHHICASWTLQYSDVQKWLEFADFTVKNKAGETCLYKLAFGSDGHEKVKAISLFTEKGLSLESRDRMGRTALLSACARAEPHFIIGLLENGANPKATDFQHKSCLHLVAQVQLTLHGDKDVENATLKIMKLLIQKGANINCVDLDGNTPFHDAVVSGDRFLILQSRLETILELGGFANTKDHRGQTALHKVACLTNMSTCDRVDFLLEHSMGLDVNARDNEGLTPIHCASSSSEIMTWRLLQAGADIQAQSYDGRTPLHFAAAAAQSNVVGLLCKLYEESSWLLDQKDEHGCTPLHYAAGSGNSECVYYLLQAGASLNITDCHGRTPLHMAAEHKIDVAALREKRKYREDSHPPETIGGFSALGRFIEPGLWSQLRRAHWNLSTSIDREESAYMMQDIVHLLLSAGADVNVRDSSGQTACDVALHLDHEDVWNVLSPHQSQREMTALMDQLCSLKSMRAEEVVQAVSLEKVDSYALLQSVISLRNEALLDSLLHAGVDLMANGPEGLTPVHYVVHWGLTSMMKIIAPYIKDINAFSPPLLHVAASRELSNLQMIDMLIKLGIDVNASYKEVGHEDESYSDPKRKPIPEYTATHILAAGVQWWNIAALESLCKAGAELTATDSDGNTVLQRALSGESPSQREHGFWRDETLEVVLRHGADINKLSPGNNSTPLLVALETKRGCKLVQRLIDHGADINLGHTPALFAAIESRNCEVTAVILNAGADVNAISYPKPGQYVARPKAQTPLLAAALGPKEVGEAIMTLLLQWGANPLLELEESNTTVFHQIAHYHGHIGPILRFMPDALEATDHNGLTPLLSVCSSTDRYYLGEESTSVELIHAGASINATDKDGLTPLHLAVRSGISEAVTVLLEKGAPCSTTNNAGLSPLYYALSHPNRDKILETTNALLAAGADPLMTGPDGETALHILAPLLVHLSSPDHDYRSKLEIRHQNEFKSLYNDFIESGCDLNSCDAQGNTPLFPFVRTVKERDEYGTTLPPAEEDLRHVLQIHDILAVNNNGDTLLHAIAGREDTRESESEPDGVWLFEELMVRGVDPRKENKQGLSALDIAAARGMQGIMKLFEKEE